MNKGKWFFIFTANVETETFLIPKKKIEIPLIATSEEKAEEEAELHWKNKDTCALAHITEVSNPKTIKNISFHDPRIVFRKELAFA